jgi:hypothetical protein
MKARFQQMEPRKILERNLGNRHELMFFQDQKGLNPMSDITRDRLGQPLPAVG